MRPLELAIPILLTLYLLWPHPRPRAVRLLPAAALVLTALHLLVEGYRWQMIPLYLLTLLLAASSLLRIRSASDGRTLVSYLVLIPLAAAVAVPVLLPVPSLPTPGGPYAVGTRVYELTDESRRELYSGRDEGRRFQIQVWYPAEVQPSDRRAPWMRRADVFAPAISASIGMPPFFLDHLALVDMPAYQDASLAPAEVPGYPVILFSHGWNGFNAQNTGQAIELASRGYVVVAVQHPYGAVVTAFEDGTFAPNNPSALPADAPDQEYEAAARQLAGQWAGDMAYALGILQEQNEEAGSPFYQSLDLSRIGAYGHSTGGGAAIEFCGTDPRCRAVLGMDPFMRPVSREVLESGVTVPAFFMFSQRWADDAESRNNRLFDIFVANTPALVGVISIAGTEHYDFTDLPLLSPLAPRLGLKGPIGGERVITIIDDYLLSFFDQTLKGVPMSLFEGTDQKYNEVRLRR